MTEENKKLLEEVAEKLKGRGSLFPEAVKRAKEMLANARFVSSSDKELETPPTEEHDRESD